MARQHWKEENKHSKRVNVRGKENIDICEEEDFRVCEGFWEEKSEKSEEVEELEELEDS